MDKRCFKCGATRPLEAFYKHAQMADGHLNKCIQCTKSDASKHRLENLERIRAYDRRRASMPHRVAKAKEVVRRWQAQHPDRRAAHAKFAYALKTGKLKPWPVCAIPDCSRKPEGHHPDYSHPLDVVWLCRPHHMQAHAVVKELEEA